MNTDLQYFLGIYKLFSFLGLTPFYVDGNGTVGRLFSCIYPILTGIGFFIISLVHAGSGPLVVTELDFPLAVTVILERFNDCAVLVCCLLVTSMCGKNWERLINLLEQFDQMDRAGKSASIRKYKIALCILHVLFVANQLVWALPGNDLSLFYFLYAIMTYAYLNMVFLQYFALDLATQRYVSLDTLLPTTVAQLNSNIYNNKVRNIYMQFGILQDIVSEFNRLFGWPIFCTHLKTFVIPMVTMNFTFNVQSLQVFAQIVANTFNILLIMVSDIRLLSC